MSKYNFIENFVSCAMETDKILEEQNVKIECLERCVVKLTKQVEQLQQIISSLEVDCEPRLDCEKRFGSYEISGNIDCEVLARNENDYCHRSVCSIEWE